MTPDLFNCLGSYATLAPRAVRSSWRKTGRSSICVVFKSSLIWTRARSSSSNTVYPKKYAHGFVVLCFVVVMQSFIMNSHEVFIHIHQGYFAGTGAVVRLPQCQWSKPDGYGKISQRITTTKHSKAKTVCIFLWIYCTSNGSWCIGIKGEMSGTVCVTFICIYMSCL